MPPRAPQGAQVVITTPAGFEGEARHELRRLLPGAVFHSPFLKGNLILRSDVPEEEALARIAEADTRFVATAVLVQRCLDLRTAPDPAALVASAAVGLGRIGRDETFLVRCRRRGTHPWSSRELERRVAAEIAEATGAVGEYEAEVDWHVTIQVYQDTAYVGVNRPPGMVQKKVGVARKYAPGERPLNRAQWKLREALEEFAIPAPTGRVLDLGSAPGGWTAVLAETAEEVVAADPADLDASVVALPNVRHLRCRAETLMSRHDLHGGFDLLTSDMNLEPTEAASILCQLAPLLKPGAPAIMTIKYVTRQRHRHEREARAILSAEYEGIGTRRLPHNAFETTAAMRRKGAAEEAPNY